MTKHMVFCQKLQQQMTGLDFAPCPGELGQKIYKNISQQAWDQWLEHQTMLINEHHLSMLDNEARQFLNQEMQNFLFGKGSAKPAGYKPVQRS